TKDLSSLSGDALLSAITVNSYGCADVQPLKKGACAELRRSQYQYHFDNQQFTGSEKTNKALRRDLPKGNGKIKAFSPEKQAIVVESLGKSQPTNDSKRGVYTLTNPDQNATVTPFISGVTAGKLVVDNILKVIDAKQFILEIFIGLGQLHRQGYMHMDIHLGNIMRDEKGRAHIIDWDFLHAKQAELTKFKGNPAFVPIEVVCMRQDPDSQYYKKAHPYQDIYGALLVSILLLKPELLEPFHEVPEKLSEAEQKMSSILMKIEDFFTQAIDDDKDAVLREIIHPAIKNSETTAADILKHMLTNSHVLVLHAVEILSQRNQDAVNKYSTIVAKFQHLSPEARKQLASGLTDALIGNTPKQLIKELSNQQVTLNTIYNAMTYITDKNEQQINIIVNIYRNNSQQAKFALPKKKIAHTINTLIAVLKSEQIYDHDAFVTELNTMRATLVESRANRQNVPSRTGAGSPSLKQSQAREFLFFNPKPAEIVVCRKGQPASTPAVAEHIPAPT
ncbi:MAG: protein kinase domain-containing protein, partial [Gammaproteobacteria bacterium]